MPGVCPRCQPRRSLEPGELKGFAVELCRGCRSLLLTRAQLEAMAAAVGRQALKANKGTANFFQRIESRAHFLDDPPEIACPNCRYNMYEIDSEGLLVDVCLNCQCIWFDEGELERALAKARTAGSIDLFPDDLSEAESVGLMAYVIKSMTDGAGEP